MVLKIGMGDHSISPKRQGDYLGEVQLVSTLTDGSSDRLAILSVLIEEGPKDHPFITSLNPTSWKFQKTGEIDESAPFITLNTIGEVNLKYLLTQRIVDQGYYYYSGSIDHPPCDETVFHLVMNAPVQMAKT